MFIGEYQHTIDHKKRMAIPSKFRKGLGKKAIVTKGIDKCLVIYPIGEWQKQAKKLENLPTGQADNRGFIRVLLAGAIDVTFDKLGRILVSDYLKNYAGLKRNVSILGLSNRIEIWDEKIWKKYKQKTEMSVGDIAERLKELGV